MACGRGNFIFTVMVQGPWARPDRLGPYGSFAELIHSLHTRPVRRELRAADTGHSGALGGSSAQGSTVQSK